MVKEPYDSTHSSWHNPGPYVQVRGLKPKERIKGFDLVETSELIWDCNAAGATGHITRKVEPNPVSNHFEVTDEE